LNCEVQRVKVVVGGRRYECFTVMEEHSYVERRRPCSLEWRMGRKKDTESTEYGVYRREVRETQKVLW
jgi:hypothetical protein